MLKIIGEFEKNDKGTWDLTLTTETAQGQATSVSHPRTRTIAVNKLLMVLWQMKPGSRFIITATKLV